MSGHLKSVFLLAINDLLHLELHVPSVLPVYVGLLLILLVEPSDFLIGQLQTSFQMVLGSPQRLYRRQRLPMLILELLQLPLKHILLITLARIYPPNLLAFVLYLLQLLGHHPLFLLPNPIIPLYTLELGVSCLQVTFPLML